MLISTTPADGDHAADLAIAEAVVPPKPAERQQSAPTLLPSPVAQAVSLATRSTSLAIRVGSLVGTFGLDAARVTTVSGLELARGMIEGVMSRAAKDTLAQTRTEAAAQEAETVLERSLDSLHYAVTQAVFWTSVSFRFTGTTLATASDGSQLLLSSLDQLFGSTDSSRAVASIITLIRREFRSPSSGLRGERVGVVDLTLALSTLAYLQQACRKTAEEERRRQSYDEIIWDVVVLSDGERIDVDEDVLNSIQGGYASQDKVVHAPSPPTSPWARVEDDEAVMTRLKGQIMASLSPGTTVSVTNSVSSVQTITVDVHGSQLLSLPTPPGAEIVETKAIDAAGNRRSWVSSMQEGDAPSTSSYRVVYKIHRNKLRTSTFIEEDDGSGSAFVELPEETNFPVPQASEAVSASEDKPHEVKTPEVKTPEVKTPEVKTPEDIIPSDVTPPVSPITKPSVPVPSRPASAADIKRRSPTSPKDFSRPTKSSARRNIEADSQVASRRGVGVPVGPLYLEDLEAKANQRKPRAPLLALKSQDSIRKPPSKKKDGNTAVKSADKKTGLKHVLRGGGQSISNMWNKEHDSSDNGGVASRSKLQRKSHGEEVSSPPSSNIKTKPIQSHTSQREPANRRAVQTPEPYPRSSSRASYVSIHDRRRDSIVSQTDSYSVHSAGGLRPVSPTVTRAEFTSHESVIRPRNDHFGDQLAPPLGHRRIRSYAPSIYSLATNDSQSSLVLSSYYQKSSYNTADALYALRREGFVDGTFPGGRLLPNITRYMRFSSACYGSNFMKLTGVSKNAPKIGVWDGTHHDIRHFAHHTESQSDNILLASFVDPQGGSDSTGSTGTGVPLVHYISLDHEAKAVVLACRGTMGFEDILADLTCEYDKLGWRGRGYRVHKGIHASARRLLYGGDGRVLVTLKEALHEFPEYGLVLCGHSLGAGVTSLLGVMLSEPNPDGPGFVTSAEPYTPRPPPSEALVDVRVNDIRLPAGRRIHVYAYGPPGVMSSSLRKITRGLITSVIHGNDLVPYLSLGLLHDFQGLSHAFKRDENQTKAEIRNRIWNALQDNVSERWYPYRSASKVASSGGVSDEERWMLPALESMRSSMKGEKLLPPGEVFTIETQRVLRRDAFLLSDEEHIGQPAQRIVMKYVRDVEGRFGEVRFGTSMLTDHSPAKYEDALNKLRVGVAE